MFGLLESVTKLAVNTVSLVTTPVAIAAEIINKPVEVIAEGLKEIEKDIKE